MAKTVTFEDIKENKKKCESRRGSTDGIPEIPHDKGTGTLWKKIAVSAPKLRYYILVHRKPSQDFFDQPLRRKSYNMHNMGFPVF